MTHSAGAVRMLGHMSTTRTATRLIVAASLSLIPVGAAGAMVGAGLFIRNRRKN